MQPMRMFNAVPRPAKSGWLLLHRAAGPATQERQLLLHIHACHAHENKIQFAIIGGTTKKLHDKTSQAQVDSASHYSCYSFLLIVIHCFLFLVFCPSHRAPLKTFNFIYSSSRVYRAISGAGTISTTAPQSHHDRNKMEATNPNVFTLLDYECKPLQ